MLFALTFAVCFVKCMQATVCVGRGRQGGAGKEAAAAARGLARALVLEGSWAGCDGAACLVGLNCTATLHCTAVLYCHVVLPHCTACRL
jgi:hypothetical protein